MVVTLTQGVGEVLSTPVPASFPAKALESAPNPHWGPSAWCTDATVCGWKQESWTRQGKEASGFLSNSKVKQHESCSDGTPAPSPPCRHLNSPWTLNSFVRDGFGDERGTITSAQAVTSLSHVSRKMNDGSAERLEEMGWKWLHLKYLMQAS